MKRAIPVDTKIALAIALLGNVAALAIALFHLGCCLDMRWFAVLSGACTIVAVPFLIRRFRWTKLLIHTLLLVSLFYLWTDPLCPRPQMLTDLGRVKTGMTISEVQAIMHRYRVWGDSTSDGCRTIIYSPRNLEGWRSDAYGADFAIVDFEGGKVTKTHFSPD